MNKLLFLPFLIFLHNNSLKAESSQSLAGQAKKYLKATFDSIEHHIKSRSPHIAIISIEKSLDKAKPLAGLLYSLRKNPNVKGLILHIDCYGGSCGTAAALHSELQKFKTIMPVIILIENQCLSSAYVLASAADYIIATSCACIGSIGVKTTFRKYKNIKFEDNGDSGDVEITVLTGGKLKGPIASQYIPLDEEAKNEYNKNITQKLYAQFIQIISQARNISANDAHLWADAQEFVPEDALKLGLIDKIGDFTDTIIKMKELLAQRGIIIDGEPLIMEAGNI